MNRKTTLKPPQCIRTGALTYYRVEGDYFVRKGTRAIKEAEREQLKQNYEATWKNLQRVWRAFDGRLRGTFQFREGRQLDYHKFLSLNLDPPVVVLTAEQAREGVTLAGPYLVSQGSMLNPVEVEARGEWFVSNLRRGDLRIGESLLFVSLLQAGEGWVRGSVKQLEINALTLQGERIVMPRREGEWGTFVRIRERRDHSLEVSTQRLVGTGD